MRSIGVRMLTSQGLVDYWPFSGSWWELSSPPHPDYSWYPLPPITLTCYPDGEGRYPYPHFCPLRRSDPGRRFIHLVYWSTPCYRGYPQLRFQQVNRPTIGHHTPNCFLFSNSHHTHSDIFILQLLFLNLFSNPSNTFRASIASMLWALIPPWYHQQ